MTRRALVWIVVLGLLTQSYILAAQAPSDTFILISEGSRQSIPTVRDGQGVFVALEDIVRIFNLDQQDQSNNSTVTISHNNQSIILTANQKLVSVSGRLVELRSEPRTIEGRWIVPVDFFSRALTRILGYRLEVRPRSQFLIAGEIDVPRISGRYQSRGSNSELAFRITPAVPYKITQTDTQVVIAFQAEAIDIQDLPNPSDTIITNIVAGNPSTSIQLSLGSDFGSFVSSTQNIRNNGIELFLKFLEPEIVADVDTSNHLPPTSLDRVPLNEIDPLPEFRTLPTIRVIAIDAGHGGKDEGTRGNEGTVEKNITLNVTKRLRETIENRLGLRVILTREQDQTVDLDQRAAIANNNKADLFVSLHVSASVRPTATGAEVFYLSMDEYGVKAQELAQEEAQLAPVLGGGVRAIDLVEWEMAQVRYVERSEHLARIVHSELNRRIPMSARGVQEAPFRVLVGANMPAVLVEMGFISNPEDERRLSSERFQNAVVDALVESIIRFRDYLEKLTTEENRKDSETINNNPPGGAASLLANEG